MKTTLYCLVIAIVLRLAFDTLTAQTKQPDFDYYRVVFVINADLPNDVVEAAPGTDLSSFYKKKPLEHPIGLPTPFELVRVFQRGSPETVNGRILLFVGWFWLDGDTVAALHGNQRTQL